MKYVKESMVIGVVIALILIGISFFQPFVKKNDNDEFDNSKLDLSIFSFAKGKSFPDSLSNDFTNFQMVMRKKIYDLDRYRTKGDRTIVVGEIEQLLCNRDIQVGIQVKGGKNQMTSISELYDNEEYIKSSISVKSAEVDWSDESGFCIKSISFSISDN
jgi:hypothetical protein